MASGLRDNLGVVRPCTTRDVSDTGISSRSLWSTLLLHTFTDETDKTGLVISCAMGGSFNTEIPLILCVISFRVPGFDNSGPGLKDYH